MYNAYIILTNEQARKYMFALRLRYFTATSVFFLSLENNYQSIKINLSHARCRIVATLQNIKMNTRSVG